MPEVGRASDYAPAQTGSGQSAAIADARMALTKAKTVVDTDRQNHSPACVTIDQKSVDQAQLQLARAIAHAKAGLLDIFV